MTASGVIPAHRQSAANDTITENNTGWTTSTRSNDGASGSSCNTASTDHPVKGCNAASHASRAWANTGNWR
ncbi:hypothetical protein DAVIS_01862 [Mycobacterium marinum]|uniref:Uncharacterized protein n=1 Tax=Mycobacterium marinum TaxID=1781 RepID=A0A3E2MY64_MYCMR|nr:hypothetical protein DAVIS_01862 [Mycobacterium marinum]RFZ54875.1 hypothetical protein BB170200_04095 [Mycobacterium marinum]RFZ60131.1 hypothetical protein DL240490_04095 [Mycobacterium marinum]